MSVFTALTRVSPEIDGLSFDATIESTLSAAVETTTYPLESGIDVADHTLIIPLEYTMTIVVSNNPLRPGITDFIGGAVSNFFNIPGFAGAAGAFSGLLSSSNQTHGAMVLQTLISKMLTRQPVDITDGDITLSSMLITSVTRNRTVENEDGLEAEITMQELPLIERIQADGFGSGDMGVNDPSKSRAGGFVAKGHAAVKNAGERIRHGAKNVFAKSVGGF